MSKKRILNAGQCDADHETMKRCIEKEDYFELIPVASQRELMQLLQLDQFDMVLLNRVFDATGESGLDVLRQLKQNQSSANIPVMLISNFDNYQQQARQLGAVEGFGKAALNSEQPFHLINKVFNPVDSGNIVKM